MIISKKYKPQEVIKIFTFRLFYIFIYNYTDDYKKYTTLLSG